jgi:chromosomal replication initiation ATPase DnaA
MTNEVQLIAEIWDAAQQYHRAKVIQLYKHKLNRYAIAITNNFYNIKRLDGDADSNLKRLALNVCEVFGLKYEEFTDYKRSVVICYPRHVYHKVAVDHYIAPYARIAKFSGRTDHTTIIASYKRANNLIEVGDKLFCNYWHRYIIHGDTMFTSIYTPEIKIIKTETNVEN